MQVNSVQILTSICNSMSYDPIQEEVIKEKAFHSRLIFVICVLSCTSKLVKTSYPKPIAYNNTASVSLHSFSAITSSSKANKHEFHILSSNYLRKPPSGLPKRKQTA